MSYQILYNTVAHKHHIITILFILAISIATGTLIALGYFLFVAMLLVGIAVYALIINRWQWGMYAYLFFIPFAGIPTIIFYPAPGILTQAKDILFLIPTYIGFIYFLLLNKRSGQKISFAHTPVLNLFLLLIIFQVIAYTFLTLRINVLVALIGLKVWLFYIPLFFISYHLIQSKADLYRIIRMMVIVSIIPASIGIAQAILSYTGNRQLVLDMYGTAAQSVTQRNVVFSIGEGTLVRISSTFTFAMQYATYTFSIIPLAYAIFQDAIHHKKQLRFLWLAVLSTTILATFSSGIRVTFIFVPVFFLLIALLEKKTKSILMMFGMFIVLFITFTSVMGSNPQDLFYFIAALLYYYFGIGIPGTMSGHIIGSGQSGHLLQFYAIAFEATKMGRGIGWGTGPARYALSQDALAYINAKEYLLLDSFYVKVIVELGIPGLVMVLALFSVLLITGYTRLRKIKDFTLYSIGASLLVFLFIQIIYLFKMPMIDFDPLNAYFWFFAGILIRLADLEGETT